MFASSQAGLQYKQSFLKQCFSNIKSFSTGKCITWEGGVGCAVKVGGAFFLFCLVFYHFSFGDFVLVSVWVILLLGRRFVSLFLSRVSCSGN